MSRKLTALVAGLLASLALGAIPAVASANVELYEGSTPLSVGTKVTTNSVPGTLKFVNEAGAEVLQCSNAKFDGQVAKTESTGFEISLSQAKFTGTGPEGKCTSGFINWSVSLTGGNCWKHKVTMGSTWYMARNLCGMATGDVKLRLDEASFPCEYDHASSLAMVHNTLDPLTLKTSSPRWFTKISGGSICPPKIGLSVVLALTNTSGGSLKEVHT